MQKDMYCRIYTKEPINQIDAGYGLIGAKTLLTDFTKEIIVDFNCQSKLEDKLECYIVNKNNKKNICRLILVKAKENLWTSSFFAGDIDIKKGCYDVIVRICSLVNCHISLRFAAFCFIVATNTLKAASPSGNMRRHPQLRVPPLWRFSPLTTTSFPHSHLHNHVRLRPLFSAFLRTVNLPKI